jgi:xanthosine utilization system XapX-like protein
VNATVDIWFPLPPAAWAVVLGILGLYIIYELIKVVASIYTGAKG